MSGTDRHESGARFCYRCHSSVGERGSHDQRYEFRAGIPQFRTARASRGTVRTDPWRCCCAGRGGTAVRAAGAVQRSAEGTDESSAAWKRSSCSGFRRSLEASLDIKRDAVGSVDAIVAEDIAKFPGPESRRVHPAHSRRLHRARCRRGPPGDGARPRPAVHARARERHGGDERERRHGRGRRHQSRPLVRLQHLRLGAVQRHHHPQDRVGGSGGRLARRHGGPARGAPVRLPGLHVRELACRARTTTSRTSSIRAAPCSSATASSTASSARCSPPRIPAASCWTKARARCAGRTRRTPTAFTCRGATFGSLGANYPRQRGPRSRSSTPRTARAFRASTSTSTIRIGSASPRRCSGSRRSATLLSVDALYAKFKAERSEIFLESPVFSTNGAHGHQAAWPCAMRRSMRTARSSTACSTTWTSARKRASTSSKRSSRT